jgi:geranylgeranyl pyrophosphate synthase
MHNSPYKAPMITDLAILTLVQDDLQRVERKLRSIGTGAYEPLAQAFLGLLRSGGKRLRPAVALAAYGLFHSRASDKVVAMAAAVEMLHNATLVHDDLIDEAMMRRGMTTLNAVWSKGATVLAGDYLFARAAGFAAETENIQVVQLFAETLRVICEGELRQSFSSRQWRQTKDSYYPRIFAKTASLFAAATRSGAVLAGAPPTQEQALYDYGYNIGMAFQIVDDILDYASDEATLGKPVGGDLRQGIVTLPFYHFLQSQPDPEAILSRLEAEDASQRDNGAGEDTVAEIVARVRASGAIQASQAEARDFTERAKAALAIFPHGSYRQALCELADYGISRHT